MWGPKPLLWHLDTCIQSSRSLQNTFRNAFLIPALILPLLGALGQTFADFSKCKYFFKIWYSHFCIFNLHFIFMHLKNTFPQGLSLQNPSVSESINAYIVWPTQNKLPCNFKNFSNTFCKTFTLPPVRSYCH